MAKITLENVTKIYQEKKTYATVTAVNNVSFTCKEGEFIVLLGPSGCGKTSMLRMIAGLEEINAGRIFIGEKFINDLSPKERNVAMAFENYALYPPLTVFENLIYPLKARGVPKTEIAKKLKEVAEILDIGDILDRRPAELSGGQQQRVSLGRCIIRDADVYLMDEPLSHIDSELRLRTRGELKRMHQLYKRTVIYVTHDQIEALALADRIAIIDKGVLHQIGTPAQVYEHAVNLFVAGFIGEPAMNFIHGTIPTTNGTSLFCSDDYPLKIQMPENLSASVHGWENKKLVLGIRPHHIHVGSHTELPQYHGEVVVYESLGEKGVLEVKVEGCPLIVLTEPELRLQPRETLTISVDSRRANLFDEKSGKSLFSSSHH